MYGLRSCCVHSKILTVTQFLLRARLRALSPGLLLGFAAAVYAYDVDDYDYAVDEADAENAGMLSVARPIGSDGLSRNGNTSCH